jgi:UDP-glucose 4-epimerase
MLLTRPGGGARPPLVIAVFGAGLIGSAVVESLASRAATRRQELASPWGHDTGEEERLRALEAAIAASLEGLAGGLLRVLWSAGRAGFSATEEAAAAELAGFRKVLALAERLARRFPDARTSFHLVSSAGGLFEGQRNVGSTSLPCPRRPYGRLKLRQEELLRASGAPLARRIHRVTSVYGYLRPRQRIGLVSALLLNGVRQRVTGITGRMSTLRDFVFVADVAAHLATALLDDADSTGESPAESVALVAAGKPFSLLEVRHLVEKALRRRIYVSYSLDPLNSEDVTVAPDALPAGWNPSDLGSNVARIYRDALCSGAFGAPPPGDRP